MTTLIVEGNVAHFSQEPLSYLAYDKLPDAHTSFDIEVTFKPENETGQQFSKNCLMNVIFSYYFFFTL